MNFGGQSAATHASVGVVGGGVILQRRRMTRGFGVSSCSSCGGSAGSSTLTGCEGGETAGAVPRPCEQEKAKRRTSRSRRKGGYLFFLVRKWIVSPAATETAKI